MSNQYVDIYGLEGKEFYNLMQSYRIAPAADQDKVVNAYEAVKEYIRRQKVAELKRREKLEHFTMSALQGLCANPNVIGTSLNKDGIVELSGIAIRIAKTTLDNLQKEQL